MTLDVDGRVDKLAVIGIESGQVRLEAQLGSGLLHNVVHGIVLVVHRVPSVAAAVHECRVVERQ